MENLKLIRLKKHTIYEQLLIEEALLRADAGNWCIFNEEASPAIVMGISGKAEELINFDQVSKKSVPIIRRFTGGGTVIVDHNTCFVTMICNTSSTGIEPFPEKVHQWVEGVYRGVFFGLDFALRENDYVFGERKFGGNAQYMQRGRWLHHSTFLWDYDNEMMECLLIPKKMPQYRQERSHDTFLSKMSVHIASKDAFFDSIKKSLSLRFDVEEVELDTVGDIRKLPHRASTVVFG